MYNGSKISGAKLRYTNMPQLTSGVSAKTYAQQCCCCCHSTAILYAHIKLLVTISLFHDNPACLVVIVFPIPPPSKENLQYGLFPRDSAGDKMIRLHKYAWFLKSWNCDQISTSQVNKPSIIYSIPLNGQIVNHKRTPGKKASPASKPRNLVRCLLHPRSLHKC